MYIFGQYSSYYFEFVDNLLVKKFLKIYYILH